MDLSECMDMSGYKQDGYNDPEFPEMMEWFEQRTNEHIKSVQEYIKIALSSIEDIDVNVMLDKAMNHDSDKFGQPLLIPYVYLTWMYHCEYGLKKEYKLEPVMQDSCNDMSFKHCKQNSHHPEFWDAGLVANHDLIGSDRDRKCIGNKPVDASLMDRESIVEFCCDLSAVGKERGNKPLTWFNKMNGKKWIFTKDQEKFIKEVFKKIW